METDRQTVRTATGLPTHNLKMFVLCGCSGKPPLLFLPLVQENVLHKASHPDIHGHQSKNTERDSSTICLNS